MTTPKLLRYLEGKRSPFVSNINKLMKKVETILNQEKVFPDHSLYDIDHSIRVMDYIYYLIPSIYKLSDLEITLLIYSALLHDIGMFAAEEEIEQIKKNRSDLVEMDFASVLLNNSGNEVEALQYCIRTTHGKRAAAWINKHSKEFCIIPFHSGISFAREVGLICQGHTESPEWLEKKLPNHNEKAGYEYNTYFCALLLRLGDILDIDSRRVPPALLDLLTGTF